MARCKSRDGIGRKERTLTEVRGKRLFRLFKEHTVMTEQGASSTAFFYDDEEEAIERSREILADEDRTCAIHIYRSHLVVCRTIPRVDIMRFERDAN